MCPKGRWPVHRCEGVTEVCPSHLEALEQLSQEGMAVPLPAPEAHLQEEACQPELPDFTIAVTLAQVMVRGPVFAAHVENEWIADAEKETRHAVRVRLAGSVPYLPRVPPELLGTHW